MDPTDYYWLYLKSSVIKKLYKMPRAGRQMRRQMQRTFAVGTGAAVQQAAAAATEDGEESKKATYTYKARRLTSVEARKSLVCSICIEPLDEGNMVRDL